MEVHNDTLVTDTWTAGQEENARS